LLVFWEPTSGYDSINNGSQDSIIKKFAEGAKAYGYPVILAPFHEMNGNWDVWDGTVGNNSPAKFIAAWKRLHDLFSAATNVKFALAYNSNSVPNTTGNQFDDYYPGDAYVDYVGVDGFNFGSPWQSFQSIFSSPLTKLAKYNKPIYIFSMGSVPGSQKSAWIADALGVQIFKYPIAGWVWFNQDGNDGNWVVNSDPASLSSFKQVIPN
jgi:beta-mannanase